MSKVSQRTTLSWVFVLAMTGIGCTNSATGNPGKQAIPTSTTKPMSSLTPFGVATNVDSSTPQVKLTSTTVPLTVKPTATMTPFVLPTLSPKQSELQIRRLLETNAGCDLPCWWGIRPGETSWDEAKQFLRNLNPRYIEPMGTLHKRETDRFEVGFSAPIMRSFGQHIQDYKVKNDRVLVIETEIENINQYRLSDVLTKFGAPDEVFINTYNSSRGGDLPFRFEVIYWRRGIRISYGLQGSEKANNIIGCPAMSGTEVILTLWDSSQINGFEQLIEESYLFNVSHLDQRYLPIEQAAGVNAEMFYELFKELNNTQCLQTPKMLWQPPS